MVGAVDEQACSTLPAVPGTVRQLRTRVTAFAQAAGMPFELLDDIALAVSETVTNAVVHAYAAAPEPGQVRVRCHVPEEQLVVEVADDGVGIVWRDDSPGLGQGLAIVGALAEALAVTLSPRRHGTTVTMTFAARTAPELAPSGLEALCWLALDTVADASCVDLLRGGALRRGAAEVAGDAGLTAWLRNAISPAKPGTATWAAARGRRAPRRTQSHSVRSPAGMGEGPHPGRNR